MSCIVLDIDLADLNFFKELAVILHGNVQDFSFRPPRKYKPTKQACWCARSLHGIVSNSRCLNYNELPSILRRDVKAEYFAKRTEKCKILYNVLDKEVGNLDDHGRPKM